LDYRKIDAALANALHEIQDPTKQVLNIFVQTDAELEPAELEFLKEKGVNVKANSNRNAPQIFTATLSTNAIEELSDQPWVKYLELAQKLKFV
jgi:hypothetical protein